MIEVNSLIEQKLEDQKCEIKKSVINKQLSKHNSTISKLDTKIEYFEKNLNGKTESNTKIKDRIDKLKNNKRYCMDQIRKLELYLSKMLIENKPPKDLKIFENYIKEQLREKINAIMNLNSKLKNIDLKENCLNFQIKITQNIENNCKNILRIENKDEIVTDQVKDEIVTDQVKDEIVSDQVKDEIVTEQVKDEIVADQVKDENNKCDSDNIEEDIRNDFSYIDFSNVNIAKDAIKNKFTIKYIMNEEKGLIRFVVERLLIDKRGKLIYICSDANKFKFQYKDKNGKVQTDMDAKGLLEYISNAGIFDNGIDIKNEWYVDTDNNVDMNKFLSLLSKKQKIINVKSDPSFFKTELVSLIKI